MRYAPEPPGNRAFQPDPPHIHDRCSLADGGEVALMFVAEGQRRRLVFNPAADHLCDISALLFCCGRNARNGAAIIAFNPCRVANGENIFVAGYAEVGKHLYAARPVALRVEPKCGR